MLLLALLAVQAAPAASSPPDIELNVHATVREVRIRQRGETSLRVYATPDAGSRAEAPRPAPNREVRGRNRTVDVHAEARIADPASAGAQAPETSPPQRR